MPKLLFIILHEDVKSQPIRLSLVPVSGVGSYRHIGGPILRGEPGY